MKVPLGRPPPALGSARKVTEVRRDENMQARTGGNTLDGHQVISLGWKETSKRNKWNPKPLKQILSYRKVFEHNMRNILCQSIKTCSTDFTTSKTIVLFSVTNKKTYLVFYKASSVVCLY